MILPRAGPQKARRRLRVAFVSSCLPRKCGIATFAESLSTALENTAGEDTTRFIALNNNETYEYSSNVIFQIEQENREHYREAAAIINSSEFDAVSLQHEFGLYGGAGGNNIVDFLSHLKKPVITTFHTVLQNPTIAHETAFIEVAAFSSALIVMSNTAAGFMTDLYDIPAEKIHLIHHGVPETQYIDPSFYKHQLKLKERFIILTFGFLSPNKGIEVMLKALPDIARKHPDVLYIILGITHPVVKKNEGEEYREKLISLTRTLGIEKNVLFINDFVDDGTLGTYLGAADLVVCPYHSGGQVTSGVLSNALGRGKPIISTPYLHAQEALAEGRGRLVNFNDSQDMATAVNGLIEDPSLRLSMAAKAYMLGQEMGWSKISQQYLDVFENVIQKAKTKRPPQQGRLHTLPQLTLNHLKNLTDDTGVVQHTLFGIPDYSHYYSADDAARALVACASYFNLFQDETVLFLLDRNMAFLAHARKDDGWFYNYMNYQREFPKQELSEDTFGRCLWGLGAAASMMINRDQGLLGKELLEKSLPNLKRLTQTRAQAYSACGLSSFLLSHPESPEAREGLRFLADSLLQRYRENAAYSWNWFENFLTYDNARLPQALLLGYRHFNNPAYLQAGLDTLDFLLKIQYQNGFFDLIGNQGWYFRNKKKALFSQQPLDAGSLTETCLLAANLSGKEKYLELAYASFQWYLGRNRLGQTLYDPSTGACADGLSSEGPSKNKGAESTISFIISLAALYQWELIGRFQKIGAPPDPASIENNSGLRRG